MPSTDYFLPQLPFGSAECVIVRWLKRAGEPVTAGEPLLVVVNDRVEVALPATDAGIFEQALVAEGAAVAAGALAATIVANRAASVSDLPDAARLSMIEIEQDTGSAPSDQRISTVRISPVARRIVSSENIDITKLQGTGISGRIMKADVLAALASQALETEDLLVSPSLVTRHSSLVTRHSTTDAYVLTAIDVNLECVAMAIVQHGPGFARRRLELSYRVCVALAAVAALPYHPLLNSYWTDTMIVARRRVHLAVVPCDDSPIRFVCDAQDLNLRGLARGLAGAAAEHSIEDSTFTIVDLGDLVWGDPAALACGGAAALGIGAVRARPLAIDDDGVDRLVLRHAVLLTLAYDARVLDQCHADAFLRDVKSRLEQFQI
jgi:pyruvate/2-oxoglutarate dehydrogenase complex dihydrolipoamide acyltransferase (E2) component